MEKQYKAFQTRVIWDGMRILFLSAFHEIKGGGEYLLMDYAQALGKKDVECWVAVPREGSLARECRKKGIKVNVIPLNRFEWKNPLPFLKTIGQLKALVKREKIDLIHSNSLFSVDFSAETAKQCRVPSVCNSRCIYPPGFAYPKGIKSADRIFCASKAVQENLNKNGFGGKSLEVFYDAVDLEKIKACESDGDLKKEFGLGNKPIVAFIGYLVKRKNPEAFLEAARLVLKEAPETKFMVVGGEIPDYRGYLDELKSLARKIGLEEEVIFTGHREDISQMLHSIDLLVCPYENEPFAGVPLMAMAARKPVVAYNDSGSKEQIKDGVNGFLTEKNPEALAEKILFLLNNPEKREEMGGKAIEFVEDFSMERYTSRLIKKYEELVTCPA